MGFFDQLRELTSKERAALYSVPVLVDAMQGKVDREMHLAHLEQAYHHVKNTMPLLMLMGGRLPKDKEWLRRLLIEYIEEETGHEDWILNDIKNIGGEARAEAVRNGQPELAVELINAFNYDFIMRRNPLGYLGMIFVLENASIDLGISGTKVLQKSLGLGEECFSYVASHSSLDVEHVQFIGKILDQLTDPKDQADIIHASKVIYQLYADMFRAIPNTYEQKAA
jgi:hypothetical protein